MAKLSIAVSAKDHRQGAVDAPCTIVEYGDYQCPSCGQAHPIVRRLQKHFGTRLVFVFRNFPLTQMHPYAEGAAEAAEFAASHEKFWAMHDMIYENQDRLPEQDFLAQAAQELDLDPAQMSEALEAKEFAARVRADFSGGVRSGVNGTPTFFINGLRHDGSYDYESLVRAVDKALP